MILPSCTGWYSSTDLMNKSASEIVSRCKGTIQQLADEFGLDKGHVNEMIYQVWKQFLKTESEI